jgi:hypothetical protein
LNYCWKKPAFTGKKKIIAGKTRIYQKKIKNDCWENQHLLKII